MCWSLQLGGDLDQMVASLLQMHFNFPYPPLAHSRTVNRQGLITTPLCVEVGVGPAVGRDPAWKIQYSHSSSSAQIMQLCTAPTDGNLIPGYIGFKPPTRFSGFPSVNGKYSQETAYLERRWFGEWFVFAKQKGSWVRLLCSIYQTPFTLGYSTRILALMLHLCFVVSLLFKRCNSHVWQLSWPQQCWCVSYYSYSSSFSFQHRATGIMTLTKNNVICLSEVHANFSM